MLDFSHDLRLVLASLAIALMAGFTGLSLTRGASRLDVPRRKAVVSMAAVALGGGIWSMHFVAMLGLQLPILFYYDALTTLVSALVAILMTGVALLILHFRPRTVTSMTVAGIIVGVGIALMHYIGMSGIELCRPVYTLFGITVALLASISLSVLAIRVAYSERGKRNIILGTLCFGVAVVVAHFLAMAGTGFAPSGDIADPGPVMGNESLAILVTLSAFGISAAFLLTGITFVPEASPPPVVASVAAPLSAKPTPRDTAMRIPHEREGRTLFLDPAAIGAVRAEGHYTLLLRGKEELFCPWSISEAEERLASAGFLRVHRSYLLNPAQVARFERTKDSGLCHLEGGCASPVPISRSRLSVVRDALGL